jgi:diguanylate cyclase (GGDEF)-like protein
MAMAEAIGASVDTGATVAAAAAVLQEATQADRVTIVLCDPEREVVTEVITTDPEARVILASLRGSPIRDLPLWSSIAESGVLAAPDARSLPLLSSSLAVGGALAFVLRHRAAGPDTPPAPLAVALCAWASPQPEFDPAMLRLVRNLGAQAALTIAAAYHRGSAAAMSDRLSDLVSWGGQLSSAERPGAVVSLAARAGAELLAAQLVGVWSIAGTAHYPPSRVVGPWLDAELSSVLPGPTRYAVRDAADAPPGLARALGELGLDWLLVAQSGDGACRLVAGRATHPGPIEERVARLLVDLTGESIRRAQAYEQMSHLAITDALTGLGNRGAFETRVEEAVAHSVRYGRPLALCVFDIDHFRDLNERGGHPLGDECLRAVAATIRAEVRGSDMAYRIGGDEFGLILPETTKQDALPLLERIIERARQRGPEPVGLTAGVAQCPDDGTSADALYRGADEALYVGKRAGRGRVTLAPGAPR